MDDVENDRKAMKITTRRFVLLVVLFGWGLPCSAQPPQPKDPIKVIVHGFPPGAYVYVETVSALYNLDYLGRVNEPFILDREKFRSRLVFQIGGKVRTTPLESPPPSLQETEIKLTNYRGYLPQIREARPSEYDPPSNADKTNYDRTQRLFYYPSKDPLDLVQLVPAPGLGNKVARTLFWLERHPIVTALLICGLGGALVFGLGVYLPRRKTWKAEKSRIDNFNTRLRNLDVKNDVFLARQFGEWATVQRLGQGGMATVYKGVSTRTMDESEAVAIKVMNPELAQDVEYRRRFNREIQISRTLDHPNVVRMIDFGEQDSVLFLAMEYIQGETLRDMLPTKGFPLHQALELAQGIVQGLIHAHQRGVVHRDLKPDNIMVTQGNLVKVMDLGLAKREESENVTRTGDTFGTPAYMAPEQITGASLQPATDQYALGVMFFELVTGRRPFEIADSLTLVMKHLQEPPPRIREYKSQLPEELELVVDRMLLKDPAKRYKSLVEVQVELTKIQRKYCPT